MTFSNSVEYLYFGLMLKWENSAPPDGHEALLDGEPARNTQITRMAYIIRKIAAGQEERTYQSLARYSRRNDGHSYVSLDSSWMKDPYPLSRGWFFEGCTSLKQKQDILQNLARVGISQFMLNCIDQFVAGNSIAHFAPSDEETEEILRRSIELEHLRDR